MLYEIDNAHNKGVTAVATTFSRDEIISGGGEGEVRLWSIGERTCKLKDAMKEQHKGKNDLFVTLPLQPLRQFGASTVISPRILSPLSNL